MPGTESLLNKYQFLNHEAKIALLPSGVSGDQV